MATSTESRKAQSRPAANTVTRAACDALGAALDAWLALDPDSRERLIPLEGKVVTIRLRGLQLEFSLAVEEGRMEVMPQPADGAPDTMLEGTPLTLLKAGLASPGERAALGGELEITGDTETGRRFQAFFQGVHIDWEEHLSRLIGDVAAHQAGNLGRGVVQWGAETREALQQDVGEYLQEEGRYLPHPDEVESFLSAVDRLRNDADRLEQRIQRLRRRIRELKQTPENPA